MEITKISQGDQQILGRRQLKIIGIMLQVGKKQIQRNVLHVMMMLLVIHIKVKEEMVQMDGIMIIMIQNGKIEI